VANELLQRTGSTLKINFHPGQTKAWDAEQRFVFVFAGTQSGKTTFGGWWLLREIERKGDGDYLAVSATYDLFKLKMLPELLQIFCGYVGGWEYHKTDRTLVKGKKRIILRAATSEAGLESATAKAAWLDECGQDDFGVGAWEAVLRRLSLEQGRVLGTTTIYNLGWLYSQVYQRWLKGDKDYYIVQFDSTMNPSFPKEEYLRAERTMPRWKFEMQYRGNFSRPAGQIYDVFDPERDVVPPFQIPPYYRRYGGLDFGGVNTAALCYAENPDTKQLYLIKEYLEGEKVSSEHATDLKPWGAGLWVGGSASEEQWRKEFRKGGLPIREPAIKDVEVGIDRVYAVHKQRGLLVFDTCSLYLDEKGRYARELDDFGQPTDKIKDKSKFHLMDAERYILGFIRGDTTEMPDEQPEQVSKWATEEDAVQEGKSRWRY
jgi:hypothetical protein